VEKNVRASQTTDENVIGPMFLAFWTTKATNMHSAATMIA
jgi:hypothetical protein